MLQQFVASDPIELVVGFGITTELDGEVKIMIEAVIAARIPIILIFLSTSVTLYKSY